MAELYSSRVLPNWTILSRLSRHICYTLHSIPYPHLRVPDYVRLGALFYASRLYPSPFWACASSRLIWTMSELRNFNGIQARAFNAPQTGSTQATNFTSGSMTELLHGSLGDTRFPDLNTTGLQTSRSTPGSDLYLNERNSTFQAQLEPPSQFPSLLSPFDPRRDTTPYQDAYSNDDSAYMRTQVSAYIYFISPKN